MDIGLTVKRPLVALVASALLVACGDESDSYEDDGSLRDEASSAADAADGSSEDVEEDTEVGDDEDDMSEDADVDWDDDLSGGDASPGGGGNATTGCTPVDSQPGAIVECGPVSGIPFPFALVPAGSFNMGASSGDMEADEDERPVRAVTLTHPMLFATTEVTQAQYATVMDGAAPSAVANAPNNPVENVTWLRATEYCNRISRLDGLPEVYDAQGHVRPFDSSRSGYRLPTEAEWEYAARAGSTEPRYGALDEIAWYGQTSDGGPTAVGSGTANAWNLSDMLGNVAEWSHNWYAWNEADNAPLVDPMGPETGAFRAHRGGSWRSLAATVRVSARDGLDPQYRLPTLGFRPVRLLPTPASSAEQPDPETETSELTEDEQDPEVVDEGSDDTSASDTDDGELDAGSGSDDESSEDTDDVPADG